MEGELDSTKIHRKEQLCHQHIIPARPTPAHHCRWLLTMSITQYISSLLVLRCSAEFLFGWEIIHFLLKPPLGRSSPAGGITNSMLRGTTYTAMAAGAHTLAIVCGALKPSKGTCSVLWAWEAEGVCAPPPAPNTHTDAHKPMQLTPHLPGCVPCVPHLSPPVIPDTQQHSASPTPPRPRSPAHACPGWPSDRVGHATRTPRAGR